MTHDKGRVSQLGICYILWVYFAMYGEVWMISSPACDLMSLFVW